MGKALSLATALAILGASAQAQKTDPLRLDVSLEQRMVYAIRGNDTVYRAPAAIGSGETLTYNGQSWYFRTPKGTHTVLSKEADPVWRPFDWHYAAAAKALNLQLDTLHANRPERLSDGRILTMYNNRAVYIKQGEMYMLPTDEHLIFDGKLFMPSINSENRKIPGELGKYRLGFGNGYFFHGTPHKESIGSAVTRGCVRLDDEAIEWMYYNVPLGAKITIYDTLNR
jgi:lipoprotein-anchoring transpeptidase ErfK/SrfK